MTDKIFCRASIACVLECGGFDAALRFEISNMRSLCLCASVAKIRVYWCPSVAEKTSKLRNEYNFPFRFPSLRKAMQGYANLRKHLPQGGEVSLKRVQSCTPMTPIIAYLRLLTPINGVFPEKKDCLFSLRHLLLPLGWTACSPEKGRLMYLNVG
jgi:hypothetical protein